MVTVGGEGGQPREVVEFWAAKGSRSMLGILHAINHLGSIISPLKATRGRSGIFCCAYKVSTSSWMVVESIDVVRLYSGGRSGQGTDGL